MNDRHLTIEWLKMFLLREITLSQADHSHLVGCSHCMKLLAQASAELAELQRNDIDDNSNSV
jgi:hypothetical protein